MDVSLEVLEGTPPRFRLQVEDRVFERGIDIAGNVATFVVPDFSAGAKVHNAHDWLLTSLRRLAPSVTDLRITLG